MGTEIGLQTGIQQPSRLLEFSTVADTGYDPRSNGGNNILVGCSGYLSLMTPVVGNRGELGALRIGPLLGLSAHWGTASLNINDIGSNSPSFFNQKMDYTVLKVYAAPQFEVSLRDDIALRMSVGPSVSFEGDYVEDFGLSGAATAVFDLVNHLSFLVMISGDLYTRDRNETMAASLGFSAWI